jgi:endonuclease G
MSFRSLFFALLVVMAPGIGLASECEVGAPLPNVGNLSVQWVCHTGYASAVDLQHKVPRVVVYHLTGEHTLGCLPRKNNFHVERSIPPSGRATSADYEKSGYDRGHQAPAEDFAWDAEQSSDSFSMANMAPQLPGLNRQGWERLEETVRAWAWQRKAVDVYVGPILSNQPWAIGSGVAIPSAFFKLIVDPATWEAISFVFPQTTVEKGDLTPYLEDVKSIMAATGLTFPVALSSSVVWETDLSGWRKVRTAACAKPH